MSLELIKSTALEAAQAAGLILKDRLGRLTNIDYKGAFNIVTDADKASEAELVRIIRRQFPDHQILCEESGAHQGAAPRRWLIDPLDGTVNYAHTYPFFCISIGFEDAGKMVFGLVFNPLSGECFQATSGRGAYLGDTPIRPSATSSISECLLATGFPPDTKNSSFDNIAEFARLTDLCHGVRRDGSAALDLCFVAAGRLEGFWEFKLAPWDLAAGSLIVREAGGKVSSPSGGEFDLASGHILASNSLVHDQIIAALGCKPEFERSLSKS